MYRMGIIFFFILLGNTFLGCVYYHLGFKPSDESCGSSTTWLVDDPLLYPTAEFCEEVRPPLRERSERKKS
jgi:hypothetical protein